MSKITDLFKKLKGLFNKNKALPETNETFVVTPSEEANKQQKDVTKQPSFKEELQELAQKKDFSRMPSPEVVISKLEELGLNPAFSQNPAAVNLIYDNVTQLLGYSMHEDKFVGNELAQEVENLLSRNTKLLSRHFMQSPNKLITLTENGNIIFFKEHDNDKDISSFFDKIQMEMKDNKFTSYRIKGISSKRWELR